MTTSLAGSSSRTALLTLILVVCAPWTPGVQAGDWFMNGDERLEVTFDSTVMGVQFAADVTEAQGREILNDLGIFDERWTADHPWLPGKVMRLRLAVNLDEEAALAVARDVGLRSEIAVASPVVIGGNDPWCLTDEILVRYRPGTSALQRAGLESVFGLTWRAPLDFVTNPGVVYAMSHGEAIDALSITREIHATGLVEWAVPDFSIIRVPLDETSDATPNDSLFGNQWHLHSTGQNGAKVDADVDALEAWDITTGDPSVIVAVVDSGMELNHPDLNTLQGIDVLDNDSDPSPEDFLFGLLSENHSTSVGGISAGTGNNGIGITGPTMQSPLIPIRFLSDWNIFNSPTNQDEVDAFNYAVNNGAAVINNSWGPVATNVPLSAGTKAAINNANQNGRNGLGTLIFFAAGNSNANSDGIGYCNYSGTMCISASTDQDKKAGYSSYGNSINVCAPSNGGATSGTWTTDRIGSIGYSSGNWTGTFGGTSSASPLACGVAALIISANPSLTWTQVQQIMQDTADKIDPGAGNYGPDGHSIYFGYGKVNAYAAVIAAGGNTALRLYGEGLAGTGGNVPAMGWNGLPQIGNASFALNLSNANNGVQALLLIGFGAADIPFKGGSLLVDPTPYILTPVAVVHTQATALTPIPNDPSLTGLSFNAQWLVPDPGAPAGLALSQGLEATLID